MGTRPNRHASLSSISARSAWTHDAGDATGSPGRGRGRTGEEMDDTSGLNVTGLEGLLVLKHATGKDEALLRGRDAGDGLDLEFQGADGGGGAVAIEGVFVALGVQDSDRILE